MIFFTSKDTPTYKAQGKFRDTSPEFLDGSDEVRLEYVAAFLDWYWEEFGQVPDGVVIDNLSTFLLRPYIGIKEEDYLILSVYSIDRRQRNEVRYADEVKY